MSCSPQCGKNFFSTFHWHKTSIVVLSYPSFLVKELVSQTKLKGMLAVLLWWSNFSLLVDKEEFADLSIS